MIFLHWNIFPLIKNLLISSQNHWIIIDMNISDNPLVCAPLPDCVVLKMPVMHVFCLHMCLSIYTYINFFLIPLGCYDSFDLRLDYYYGFTTPLDIRWYFVYRNLILIFPILSVLSCLSFSLSQVFVGVRIHDQSYLAN